MPARGFKSVTVSEGNHRLAKTMADEKGVSISSIYEECVNEKYTATRIVDSSKSIEAQQLRSSPQMRSSSLESMMQGVTGLKDNVADLQTEIEIRKTMLERDPADGRKMVNLAKSHIELGSLYQSASMDQQATEEFMKAKEYYQKASEKMDVRSQLSELDEMLNQTGPTLEMVLTLNIPGKDSLIISRLKMGEATNLIKAAAEILQYNP
jgi:hypothetical protein